MQCAKKLAQRWNETQCVLYTKCSACVREEDQVQSVQKSVGEWAAEQLLERDALLFIGACGIAVRAIAPHITDKLNDSPVLVMDERGQYVIPILSGHFGGANKLAVSIAQKLGAQPIITTATDINHQFAVDLFAKKNELFIENKDGIAKISSRVLSGQEINIAVEPGHIKEKGRLPQSLFLIPYPPESGADIVVTSERRECKAIITLRPREYVLGVGCKRGKEAEKIADFIAKHLRQAGISLTQTAALCSIAVKKDEAGLLAWSKKNKIPFFTYTAEELERVAGAFHKSEFVKEQVGVDNVCERAALKRCGRNGTLVYEKHAEDGMTIAIAKREWSVDFDEA